uniref:Glycoprotein hormone subunit beta 5 n=1 Tax=Salmo trutta TaxID=8032 RepID=A0A674E2H6_SALTR
SHLLFMELGSITLWYGVCAGCVLCCCGHGITLIQASSINLPRFIGCCVGLHITTDTCWGRCETWEKPVLDPPYIESYHRVCTYNKTHLVTVQLPNCLPNMDPMYTYPVALRCDLCLTSTTECITYV